MNRDKPPSPRVAQALDIHRSIAACHDYLARSNDVHALTAALMLPCYRAELGRLQLKPAEEHELASALGPTESNSEPARQAHDGRSSSAGRWCR